MINSSFIKSFSVAIGVITMLPIFWYIYYWKVKFRSDILAAEVLVPQKQVSLPSYCLKEIILKLVFEAQGHVK